MAGGGGGESVLVTVSGKGLIGGNSVSGAYKSTYNLLNL